MMHRSLRTDAVAAVHCVQLKELDIVVVASAQGDVQGGIVRELKPNAVLVQFQRSHDVIFAFEGNEDEIALDPSPAPLTNALHHCLSSDKPSQPFRLFGVPGWKWTGVPFYLRVSHRTFGDISTGAVVTGANVQRGVCIGILCENVKSAAIQLLVYDAKTDAIVRIALSRKSRLQDVREFATGAAYAHAIQRLASPASAMTAMEGEHTGSVEM
jgi:hypothetical protein